MSTHEPLNEFLLQIASASSASAGVTVTPGNNTYGAFVQLLSGAQVTDDAYGILINLNAIGVSGAARDAIAQIGADPAGGTNYAVVIPDLLVSCASLISGVSGGIWYYFPISFRAGTSIAVAVSVNNATVGTCSAFCRLMCKPSGPIPRTGTFVRAFGVNAGASSGTAITPNSAGSKSAYVQLGSALGEPLWWWCLGVGCNNAAMNNNNSMWDLAIGSSTTVNRPVVVDQLVCPTAAEAMTYFANGSPAMGAIGDLVFARAGATVASPTGMSAAAYGVGG